MKLKFDICNNDFIYEISIYEKQITYEIVIDISNFQFICVIRDCGKGLGRAHS